MAAEPKRTGMVRPPRLDVIPEGSSLPIETLHRAFPGEWVLVRITDRTADRGLPCGQVIAHSRSHRRIQEALVQAHRDDPTILTCVFFGYSEAEPPADWWAKVADASALLGSAPEGVDD